MYDIRTGVTHASTKIQKFILAAAAFAFAAALTLSAGGVLAAPDHTLFGEASYVNGPTGRAVQMVSDSSPGYGGVDFVLPSGISTFADLTKLATDFNPTDDGCAGGSPRFQINVPEMGPLEPGDTSGEDNIFVYFGPNPVTGTCTLNIWQNTTDLLDPGKNVDTSQLGGTFYHEYTLAVAQFGSVPVLGIQLVTDAGWAFGDSEQTVLADNVMINNKTYTFEIPQPQSKNECKNGGWQDLADSDGSPFKNQGDCVSYVATGGKNKANG